MYSNHPFSRETGRNGIVHHRQHTKKWPQELLNSFLFLQLVLSLHLVVLVPLVLAITFAFAVVAVVVVLDIFLLAIYGSSSFYASFFLFLVLLLLFLPSLLVLLLLFFVFFLFLLLPLLLLPLPFLLLLLFLVLLVLVISLPSLMYSKTTDCEKARTNPPPLAWHRLGSYIIHLGDPRNCRKPGRSTGRYRLKFCQFVSSSTATYRLHLHTAFTNTDAIIPFLSFLCIKS